MVGDCLQVLCEAKTEDLYKANSNTNKRHLKLKYKQEAS